MRFSGNYFHLRQHRSPRRQRATCQSPRIMVAFKEEFPYLRTNSGQLFEFSRDWLHAAITRAADEAGCPSWWLTDHVTESIAFYLHLRNDENVVAFNQLQETVQYVLKADRKSTRLNSSHDQISYAVFCLKKKKKKIRH